MEKEIKCSLVSTVNLHKYGTFMEEEKEIMNDK